MAPLVHGDAIQQVRDLVRVGLAGVGCGVRQHQRASLELDVVVGVLRDQPRRGRAILADHVERRPSELVDHLGEASRTGVVLDRRQRSARRETSPMRSS